VQFFNSDLVAEFTRAQQEFGLARGALHVELTESSLMRKPAQAMQTMQRLHEQGISVSLDDFGTGYSSLSQLHGLALTKLKIDRSFITNIQSNPASYKIVKSLLALSADMGLECVSEGVETAQELEVLRRLGCVLVQGYLIAKPMSPEDSVAWLRDRGRINVQARHP
jgi:EAL domain-containing protein (putative c-di-GMP-specific phosphodiesterase class I)